MLLIKKNRNIINPISNKQITAIIKNKEMVLNIIYFKTKYLTLLLNLQLFLINYFVTNTIKYKLITIDF